MSNLSVSDKMAAARLFVVKQAPYFTSVLLSLVPREAPGLGTLGVTDRGVLLWDPAFVETVTVPQLGAVLAHEVGHVLRDHAGRRVSLMADPDAWNLAGDAEINDDLIDGGWELPHHPVLPKTLKMKDGLTAEEYYAKVKQMKEEAQAEEGDEEGQGESGEEDGDSRSGKSKGKGKEEKPKGPCKGWCGSGAGRPLPGEPSEGEEPGKSQSELERVRNEVAEAIKVAVATKGQGTIPAGWQRWADERLQPAKIPWRQKLARLVRGAVAFKAGMVDMTYRKRSRRQAGVGYGPGAPILPAFHAPVPKVECWLDTSGSMGDKEIQRGLSEISGVLKATGADVIFGACDARVHARGCARRWQDLIPMVKGGGGTDFNPIFEEVSKPSRRFPRPDVLIFVTDGYGPAPKDPPIGMTVIWVLVGAGVGGGAATRPTTWGEYIEITED